MNRNFNGKTNLLTTSIDIPYEDRAIKEWSDEALVDHVLNGEHEARKKLKQDMVEMVEDVLKDNAPDDEMADRVFELLCAYPSGGRLFSKEIRQTLEEIGESGKDGFARVLDLPHSRSRVVAVHYLGREYQNGGPLTDLALDLLKKSLSDSNRGVRMKAVGSLLCGGLKLEPDVYIKEIMPLVIPLFTDSSKRARRSIPPGADTPALGGRPFCFI